MSIPISIITLVLTAPAAAAEPAPAPAPVPGSGPAPHLLRIAVVCLSNVFEGLDEKKDNEKRLMAQVEVEKKRIKEFQDELKKLQTEQKNLREGSEEHRDLTLRVVELEYRIRNLEKENLRRFDERRRAILEELQGKISAQVRRSAEAAGIDLVLEKTLVAGSPGREDTLSWPVVHYARPGLEITAEIIRAMNTAYARPPVPSKPPGDPKTESRPAPPSDGR